MHRIHVDLPDPDGPSTTTTSCSLIVAETLSRAWKSSYHFDTSSQTIMSRASDRSRVWLAPVPGAAVSDSGVSAASVMTSPRLLGSYRSPRPVRRSMRWLALDIW